MSSPKKQGFVPDSEPMMVVNDLCKIFCGEMRAVFDEAGIPSGYRQLLRELNREDGLTQSELCDRTRLSAPTVSLTLRKMEADGYVMRRTDMRDGRAVRVFLTENGERAHAATVSRIREIDAAICDGFGADEKAELLRLLLRGRDNLENKLHANRKDQIAK